MSEQLVDRLVAAMEGECGSFDACVLSQRKLAKALEERDWPDLEAAMAEIEAGAELVRKAENTRIEAEAALRDSLGMPEATFDSVLFALPEHRRTALADARRKLRIASMRSRLENGAVAEYAKAKRELLGSVLEELFPDKKGRLYGRSGRAIQPGHDALIFDTAM